MLYKHNPKIKPITASTKVKPIKYSPKGQSRLPIKSPKAAIAQEYFGPSSIAASAIGKKLKRTYQKW